MLVIAVIGGMRHPIGPFLGAALYVLLKTFAIDIVGADRFNTLIGAIFLIDRLRFAGWSSRACGGVSRRRSPRRPLREAMSRGGAMFNGGPKDLQLKGGSK